MKYVVLHYNISKQNGFSRSNLGSNISILMVKFIISSFVFVKFSVILQINIFTFKWYKTFMWQKMNILEKKTCFWFAAPRLPHERAELWYEYRCDTIAVLSNHLEMSLYHPEFPFLFLNLEAWHFKNVAFYFTYGTISSSLHKIYIWTIWHIVSMWRNRTDSTWKRS